MSASPRLIRRRQSRRAVCLCLRCFANLVGGFISVIEGESVSMISFEFSGIFVVMPAGICFGYVAVFIIEELSACGMLHFG